MPRKNKWDSRYPIPYTHRNNELKEDVINPKINMHLSTTIQRKYSYGILQLTQIVRYIKKGVLQKNIIHHPLID